MQAGQIQQAEQIAEEQQNLEPAERLGADPQGVPKWFPQEHPNARKGRTKV